MTNKEALLAQFSDLQNVKDSSIEFHLTANGLAVSDTYSHSLNEKSLDMALAGLLWVLATSPKSISELDFSITQLSPEELLSLRTSLFTKWGIEDPMAPKKPAIRAFRGW